MSDVRRWSKEEVLLLAISVTAAAAAIVSVREAAPPRPGLWLATAAALALALTGVFAVWFGGAARRRLDAVAPRRVGTRRGRCLSAIPDGLVLVRDGRDRARSTGVSATCSASIARSFSAGRTRSPSGRPEHRHEIEAWHAELEARGELGSELTFCRRGGDRIRVLVAGRVVDDRRRPRQLVTVRDASASHRRERRLTELSARDPETGLLDRREFEERLGHAVRRARKSGTNVTVVLAQIATGGRAVDDVLEQPEALVAVDRLERGVRAGDELARTGKCEIGWILPETDAAGGIEAVSRWRSEIADVGDVTLTAGVCDLASAGDALSLYALADRALADARRKGLGETAAYQPPAESRPLPSRMV